MTRVALVVEDERDTGFLLAEHLRLWGFDPTVLAEGKPAISWVRQNKPELVLRDLLLPDMIGFEVCETLNLDRQTNLNPLTMITRLSDEQNKVHHSQVETNRCLTNAVTEEN